MVVFLVRHASHDELGRVLSGRSDITINAAGRAEAGRLAQHLAGRLAGRSAGVTIGAIHSSPRPRARETAAIIAEAHGVSVEDAEDLDEIDFGSWAGKTFDALAGDPAWQEWNARRGTASTPGGEGMKGATARAVRHIEAAAGEAPLVCVSHGDVIRGVVAHYLGLESDRLLSFDVDPASLTEIALHPGGGRIVSINERAL